MEKALLVAVLSAHVAFLCHSPYVSAELPPEKVLILDLMKEYKTPLGRPIQNANESLPVFLSLELYRVMETYPEERKLVVFAGLKHMWEDSALKWDPSAYSGVTKVNLDIKEIWSPDVEHINALEPPRCMLTRSPRPLVSFDGHVTWETIYKFTTDCARFDRGLLTCHISIGSYSTTNDRVRVTSEDKHMSTHSYENNEQWEMHSTKVNKQKWSFEHAPKEDYSDVVFEIKLRQRDWHTKKEDTPDNKAPGNDTSTLLFVLLAALFIHRI